MLLTGRIRRHAAPAAGAKGARRRQRGLSLIEMAVVVSILGILLVAVAPGISQQLRNAQIRNAAESIQKGLQQARVEAINRNQDVRFSLVSDLSGNCALSAFAGSWVISRSDPSGQCADPVTLEAAAEPGLMATHDARDGNTLAAVVARRSDNTTAASSVIFNGLGRPKDGAQLARVTLTSPTDASTFRSYQVIVSASGGVRMCDLGVTASDDPRRCPS